MRTKRKKMGSAIVELAAGLTVVVPLTMLSVYSVFEACQYILINNCLSESARVAARRCAVAYGAAAAGPLGTADSQGANVAPSQPTFVFSQPSTVVIQGTATSTTASPPLTPNEAFQQIRLSNMVTNNTQFVAHYTPPAPNNQDPSLAIGRVTVVVTYQGTFPTPDPLGLSARIPGMTLTQSCTYPLEF